jgi:hypothetical protein
MAKWTGLGDNTELFWAVLSQTILVGWHYSYSPKKILLGTIIGFLDEI